MHDFKDLELFLFPFNNNLHAVVHPLAVFGISKDPFAFAIKSSATPNSTFIAIFLPLPVIRAFVASNFSADSEL